MAKVTVATELTASVWKIEAVPGARIAEGDTLVILESMKMEIPVMAPEDGVVVEILVAEGDQVSEGQPIATLEV